MHDFDIAAGTRGNRRNAAGEGMDQSEREGFVKRRKEIDVVRLEQVEQRRFRHRRLDRHPRRAAGALDDILEMPDIGRIPHIADNSEMYATDAQIAGIEQWQRFDRGLHALEVDQPADEQQPQLLRIDQGVAAARLPFAVGHLIDAVMHHLVTREGNPAGVVQVADEAGAEDGGERVSDRRLGRAGRGGGSSSSRGSG